MVVDDGGKSESLDLKGEKGGKKTRKKRRGCNDARFGVDIEKT